MGSYLTDRPQPFRRTDTETARRQLLDMLTTMDFAPQAAGTDETPQVLLHHCPFRETAVDHREIVCSVLLGLTQGMLAELDAPVTAERLDPLVEPNLCITHLTDHGVTTSVTLVRGDDEQA